MPDKNTPNTLSIEYKRGFKAALDTRGWTNPYSGNTDFSAYRDFEAGHAEAGLEIKMFGIDRVKSYFKFYLCSSAVGKPLNEAKEIIRTIDGKVQRREINAVMLHLNTLSKGYNKGVEDFISGKTMCPFDEQRMFIEYLEWRIGYDTAELAIKLHGRETVVNCINNRRELDKPYHDFANGRYRQGFRHAIDDIDFNPFYLTSKPSEHLDFKAGYEQAKKEIKDYGRDYVREYFRAAICSFAVGKPEDEVKEIIRLSDGSIPRHEYGAIFMYLDSNLETFNAGVLDFIKGKPRLFDTEKFEDSGYENWNEGYRTAELAVRLHGREAVMHQIILRL